MGLGKTWLPVEVYYVFAILSLFWSVNSEESGDTAFAYFTFLLLMLAISTQNYNEGEILYLKRCLHWSSRISVIVTWLFASFSDGRLLIESDIMAEDPNYLCAYFYFGISCCMENYFCQKGRNTKIKNIIELLFYLFTIFFTGSRGGLLGGMIVAGIVFFRSSGASSKKSIISKVLLVGMLVLLVPIIGSLVDSDVMQRFSKENLFETDGSGRFDIWEDAINAFSSYDMQSMLIGKGMGASREVAKMFNFSRVNVMHNVFLENLIGIGLIGTFLYLWNVLTFYRQSRKSHFAMSVFVGMIVLSLSTSILYLKPSWNSMFFVVCASMAIKRKTNYEKCSSSNA